MTKKCSVCRNQFTADSGLLTECQECINLDTFQKQLLRALYAIEKQLREIAANTNPDAGE